MTRAIGRGDLEVAHRLRNARVVRANGRDRARNGRKSDGDRRRSLHNTVASARSRLMHNALRKRPPRRGVSSGASMKSGLVVTTHEVGCEFVIITIIGLPPISAQQRGGLRLEGGHWIHRGLMKLFRISFQLHQTDTATRFVWLRSNCAQSLTACFPMAAPWKSATAKDSVQGYIGTAATKWTQCLKTRDTDRINTEHCHAQQVARPCDATPGFCPPDVPELRKPDVRAVDVTVQLEQRLQLERQLPAAHRLRKAFSRPLHSLGQWDEIDRWAKVAQTHLSAFTSSPSNTLSRSATIKLNPWQ